MTHLEDKECDVCLVQETYLKSTDTAKIREIQDNGWNIYSSPRSVRSGGGIGVLFRDGVTVRLAPVKDKFKTFQVQEVLIGGHGVLEGCETSTRDTILQTGPRLCIFGR